MNFKNTVLQFVETKHFGGHLKRINPKYNTKAIFREVQQN